MLSTLGIFSASGGYHEYIRGISCVHQEMLNTSEECHDSCGDIKSTSEMFGPLKFSI